jgi:hypothetical protein
MDLLTENSPETCASLGLKCSACVRQAAHSVAGLCRDLDSAALQQTFVQLYPSPFCRPMAQAFAVAYLQSTEAPKPILTFASAAASAAA